MSLERLAELVRGRWRLVFIVWVAVVAAAATASFLSRPRYSADAVLMVEPRTPDPMLDQPLANGMRNHIPTEIEVVQSERVARAALRQLGLQDDPAWRARWQRATEGQGDMEAWLAGELLHKLDVRPMRESNVIKLSFSADSPDVAAAVVNAFTQAYVRISNDMRLEPARQYNSYFDESARRLRAELQQAQARLAAYQQRNQLFNSDEKIDVESTRLSELSSQVVMLQAIAAEADGRRRQAETNQDGLDYVQRNPAVLALETEVARQESRLNELLARLGEQHPTVIEARQSLNGMRQKLASTSRRAAQAVGIESRIAQDRLAQARRALEDQRAKVLALKNGRSGAQVLEREVENAQRAYDAVLTRSSQTQVEAGAARGTVSVLQAATAPLRPDWPRHKLNLVAAAIAGLLIAVFAAIWREGGDRRLRVAGDVGDLLEHSLLIALPDTSKSQRRLRLAAP